ncbi:MAG TPA: phosphomannomutase/phosphoglucomutase [Gammaproteobacteria bacterium]|nr:phosphomannomutase/phosphoglucomutase [Gammaproteobacteria bacterium]
MGLINRNVDQAASQAGGGKGGRALVVYLLPTLLVGIALMVVVALFAQQAIHSGASRSARATAQSVSEAVAARLAGAVTARRDLLALVLSEGRAAAALSSGDPSAIKAEEAVIQQRVAGLLQVRLLPRDASQPDPAGAAPLGYAGLDLLRRTVDSGRPSAAEIHQIKSGAPYLAMALPVNVADGNAGVLFAAWDMRFLVGLLEQSPAFQGRLQLVQGGDGGYVLAKGPGGQDGPLTEGAVEVPDSIWKVSYGTDPDTGGMGGLLTMASVVAAGGLALLLSVFLQWRALARDLRADMGTLVNLGEAILRRENGAARQAQVASTRDAIALLSQYARESREMPATAAAPAVRRAVPMGGLPQSRTQGMEVEELDSDPAELLAARPRKAPKIDIPDTLFRAYDVRGVVGQALTGPFAELLGQAVATLVQEQGGHRVAVARDARPSSPQLAEALVRGLNAGGCDVLDIGQAPTPLLYFAMHTQPVQAGVVVTGSHNPADYNGFKIVIGDRVLDGDELLALRRRMLEGVFSQGNGSIERVDLVAEYVEAVVREVQLARPLKVVVDAGNGVAGDLAVATLEALGCEVVPLFCEPDGSFPNHHPDPSQPDNLASLMLEVQAQDADIGIALDGDGDRLGVIDNTGANVWPDSILMLLAADILGRHPGVDILYDVKSSRHLASFILGHGGRPIMWKSGHSRMRAKMLETGALLGGEFSGHLFIKERWFGFDDAVYAAVRVLELLALEPRGASELFAELPSSPSTPEYHLMLEEGQSRELMRALDAHKVFDDARLVELDGLRVEFGSGWGLIRPSNTTPSLTFRFEADDERSLEEIKSRFRDLLRRVAPDMQAPF